MSLSLSGSFASTIVNKLLNRLTSRYDRSPAPILGIRLSYQTGQMTWTIADDMLTTVVTGGIGQSLSVDLTTIPTLSALATYLASQPGYVVLYLDNTGYAGVSPLALVEGSGTIAQSNGDHIYLATNPNWAYMSACSQELLLATYMITQLPLEMSTTTADGEWLDLLGSYYAVPRELAEADVLYGPRIPAEVILPRQNNVAISNALTAATGQPATCVNAVVYGNPEPRFDGAIKFDGSHFYNASAARIYGLFNVTIGYAILGGLTPAAYAQAITGQIDRLRAAGTHLLNLTIGSSVMGDTVRPATDSYIETILEASLATAPSSVDIGVAMLPYLQTASFSADSGVADLSTGRVSASLSAYIAAGAGFGIAVGE